MSRSKHRHTLEDFDIAVAQWHLSRDYLGDGSDDCERTTPREQGESDMNESRFKPSSDFSVYNANRRCTGIGLAAVAIRQR